MTDHQTSPVGEDAERAAFEAWIGLNGHQGPQAERYEDTYTANYVGEMWEAWQASAARRAAPALDTSGLPPAEPLCTMRSAFEAIDFVAESKMPSAAHWAISKLKRVEVAAPTQPKAQVGSIGADEMFKALAAQWAACRELYEDDDHKSVVAAWAALIANIDAWVGSRAGDAAPAWVSVKNALPPSGKRVLVTRFAGRVNGPEHPGYPGVPWVEVSHVYNNVGFMCDLCSTGNVTHWAEIEAAPAPGKQAGNDQDAAV